MTNSRAKGVANFLHKYVLDANQSVTSSTTLVDVTGFKFSLPISKGYGYEILLIVDGHASGDMKIQWSLPSGAIMYHSDINQTITPQTAINATTEQVIQTTTTDQNLLFKGRIVMSTTSGDIKMQFAQNTSNGTPSTLNIGSYITVIQS